MKQVLLPLVILAVAGCASDVPDSAQPLQQGVGFGDYNDFVGGQTYSEYQASRDGVLTGLPEGPAISTETLGASTAAAPTANNPGISDEQSFTAVSARESIQSDAQRLAQQRAAYEQAAVEALPERSRSSGPNIVEYALTTSNSVGVPVYKRGRTSESKFQRACSKFTSADLAQQAFLDAGGPDKDKLGVDPDGDGFACGWNPAPFRAARAG